MRSTGQVIVDSLVANGIDRVFCVAGESYLGLLNALWGRSDIDTVNSPKCLPQAAAVCERLYQLYRSVYFALGTRSAEPAALGGILPDLRKIAAEVQARA